MASSPSEVAYEPGRYWTSRDFHTSARLHLQHWLFQGTLGFLLHPTIARELEGKPEIRLADIACGNGAWLCDLSSTTASSQSTYDFIGFDITPANFPHSAFLPHNVSLQVQDVLLSSPPSELEGSFDVVHVRAFAGIIRNNDTDTLLGYAAKLLKPGGWFQWEEAPPQLMTAVAPNESVGKAACEQLLAIIRAGGRQIGTVFEWFDDLPSRLESHGFEDVQVQHLENRPEHFKAWTEDYLLVYEELASHIPPESQVGANAPLTRERYQALFGKVLKETGKGVVLQQGKVMCVVGRKKKM